jgi:hypothetical protein
MTATPDLDITPAQRIRALAEARGLDRALAQFPAAVAAAHARGGNSLSPLPADFSPVTEPALRFDPGVFGEPE